MKKLILFTDKFKIFDSLTDEQAGQMIKAIGRYLNGEEVKLEGLLQAVFVAFQTEIDGHAEEYEKKCERVAAARKNNSKHNPELKSNNAELKSNKNYLKSAEDKDKDKDKDKEKTLSYERVQKENPSELKKFSPPTVEEVTAYCAERGNGIDPERFIDFYAMKGWRIGKNKTLMVDWRAAVRTWEKRDKEPAANDEESDEDRLARIWDKHFGKREEA